MIAVREVVALVLAATLVGCGSPRVHRPTLPSAPALTVTVFNDGFHSGLILPYEGMPLVLDRQRDQALKPLPYVEIGFGESQWVQNLDRSFLHKMRLGMWPSDGMIMLVNHSARLRTDADRKDTRYYTVQVTEAGRTILYAEIARWLDTRNVYVRPPDDPLFLYESTRTYTVFRNCHDFTVELLRAMRFPISRGWVNTSGRLDRKMKAGLQRLREEGVEAVGP